MLSSPKLNFQVSWSGGCKKNFSKIRKETAISAVKKELGVSAAKTETRHAENGKEKNRKKNGIKWGVVKPKVKFQVSWSGGCKKNFSKIRKETTISAVKTEWRLFFLLWRMFIRGSRMFILVWGVVEPKAKFKVS